MPRGRNNSLAQIMSRSAPGAVVPGERPKPPDGMGESEAVIWKRIVNAMPGGWFGPECHDLLARYCEIMARTKTVGMKLSEGSDGSIPATIMNSLMSCYREDLKIANTLSFSLRISPRSRLSPSKAKSLYDGTTIANRTASSTASIRPWEITADSKTDDEADSLQ
jgi:hypothetical protein